MYELKAKFIGDNVDNNDIPKEEQKKEESKLVGRLIEDEDTNINKSDTNNILKARFVGSETTEQSPDINKTAKRKEFIKVEKPSIYVPEKLLSKDTTTPIDQDPKYKSVTFNEMKDVFNLFDNMKTKDLTYYSPDKISDQERAESLKNIQEKYGYVERQPLATIAAKGVEQGFYDLMEANSFVWKLSAKLTRNRALDKASEEAMKFWRDKANNVNVVKDVLENPFETGDFKTLIKPSWLVYNVARMSPGMLASMAFGLGVESKLVSMIKPEKIPFMARTAFNIIKTLGVGSYAGIQEGASTYNTVKEIGGTESDAVKAGLLMTGSSAYLNSLSIEKLFSFMGDKTASKLAVGMITEALTEYAEEPAEGGILATTKSVEYNMDDFKKQMRDGLAVIPPTIMASLITYGLGSIYSYNPKNSKEKQAKEKITSIIEEHPEEFGNLKEKAKDVVIDENVIQKNAEELLKNIKNIGEEQKQEQQQVKLEPKEEITNEDVAKISQETQTNIEETLEYKHIIELANQMEETKKVLSESESFVKDIDKKIKSKSRKDIFTDYWNNFVSYFSFLDNNVFLNFGIFKNLNSNKIQEILSEYRNFNASVLNSSNIYMKEIADLFDFNDENKAFKQMSSFALYLENPTKYKESASKFINIEKAEKARDLIFKFDGIQKENLSKLTDKIINTLEEKGIELSPLKKHSIKQELDVDAVFARNNKELLDTYYQKMQLKSVIYSLMELGDVATYNNLIFSDVEERAKILNDLFSNTTFLSKLKEVSERFNLPFKENLFNPKDLEYNWAIVNINTEDFKTNKEYRNEVLNMHKLDLETFKRLYDVVNEAILKGENIEYVPMHRTVPEIYKKTLAILEYSILNNDNETLNKLMFFTNLSNNTVNKLKEAYKNNDIKQINKIIGGIKAKEHNINYIYTSVLKKGYSPKKVATIISDIEKEAYGRMYLYDIFDKLPVQIQMRYTDPYFSSIYHIITTAYKYAERSMIYKLLNAEGCFITKAEYEKLTDEQKKYYSLVPTEILQNHPYLSDFYVHNVFISFYSENLSRSFENFPMLNSIRKISNMTRVLVDLMFMNPFIMGRLNFDQTLVSQPSALPNVFRTILVDMFHNPKRYYKYYTIALNVGMITERTERSKLLRKSIEKDINTIGKFSAKKQNLFNLIQYNKEMSSNKKEGLQRVIQFIYNYTIDALKTISFEIIDKGFKVGVAQTIYDRYYNNLNTYKKIENAMVKHKISYSDIQNLNEFNNIEINMDEFEKTRHRLSVLLTRKYIQETQVSKIIGEFGNMPHTTSAILKTFFTAMDIRFSYTFALLKGIAKIVSFEPTQWISEDYIPGDIKSIEFKTKTDNKGNLKTHPKINLSILNILLSAIVYSLLFVYIPRYRKGYYLRKGYTLTERNVEDDVVFFRTLDINSLAQYFEGQEEGPITALVDKYFADLEKGYGAEYHIVRSLSRNLQSILKKTQHDIIIEDAMLKLKETPKVDLTAKDLRIAVDKNVVPQDVASAFLKILHKGWGGLLPMYSPLTAIFMIGSELSKEGEIKIYTPDGVKIKATYNDNVMDKLSAMVEKYFRSYTFIGNSIRVLTDNKMSDMEKLQSVLFTLYFYYVRNGKSLKSLLNAVSSAKTSPEISYVLEYDRNGKQRDRVDKGNVYNYLVALVWSDPKLGVGGVQYKRAMQKMLLDIGAFEDTKEELEYIEKAYRQYLKSDGRAILERITPSYSFYYQEFISGRIDEDKAVEEMTKIAKKYSEDFLKRYKQLTEEEIELKSSHYVDVFIEKFKEDLREGLRRIKSIKESKEIFK